MKYLEDKELTKLTSELTDVTLGRSRVINGRLEVYTMKRAGTDKKYAHALGERYVEEMQTVETQLSDYRDFLQRHSRLVASGEAAQLGNAGRKRSCSTGTQLEAMQPAKQQRPRSNSHDGITSASKTKSSGVTGPIPSSYQLSPLGDFGEMGTRRLMTDLILTLNASFPDYDFSNLKPSDFEKITVPNAVKRVNERLSELAGEKATLLSDLWSAMDATLSLSECDVYTYAPKTRDEDDDPLSFMTQTLVVDPNEEESPNDNSSDSHSMNNTVLWSFNYFFVNKSQKRIVFFTCVETMRNEEPQLEDDDEVSFVRFHGTDASEVDFDLDPSSDIAGGIPISI